VDLVAIQKANMQQASAAGEEATKTKGTGDLFDLYKPDVPFEWDPKVKNLFEFCKQPSARKAAELHVEGLPEPSQLGWPVPSLDRSAVRQFKQALKGYDKVKKTQALAALNMDNKLLSYQKNLLNLMKLAYEASKQLASPAPSLAELLKINSTAVALLFKYNGGFVTDCRESGAFYLDCDVELVRNLPLPEAGAALFDQAFVTAAEAERKKDQVLYTQQQPATSTEVRGEPRQTDSQRYKPYMGRKPTGLGSAPRNGARTARRAWFNRGNEMPPRHNGELFSTRLE
jgi:hypothetical protein